MRRSGQSAIDGEVRYRHFSFEQDGILCMGRVRPKPVTEIAVRRSKLSVELVEAICNSVPDPTNAVDLLGRLVWMTEDDGHSIFELLKSWLRDDDIRRVARPTCENARAIFFRYASQ
jgi:hypothetical protein